MKETYYIYHIPGVKIGCTTVPEYRVRMQGYTDWEILEEHGDGWLAGDREKELQAEYGYQVDKVHYMQSCQNWTEDGRKRGGRKNVESGHLKSISSKGGKKGGKKVQSIERTCPYCQKTIKGSIYFRWHGDNCKHKK